MKTFSKLPTTIDQQITILQDRGMIIEDLSEASFFLEYCYYYRFCGYALHYEKFSPANERMHQYKEGTKFSSVKNLYYFDMELRKLIFSYLSLIEIDFRGTLSNISATYYNNPH